LGHSPAADTAASAYPDPKFLAASGAFTYSPGIALSVLEPSTWATMILGFAVLGFVGYRTRKTSVSIAW
jgi:hypothetical protein